MMYENTAKNTQSTTYLVTCTDSQGGVISEPSLDSIDVTDHGAALVWIATQGLHDNDGQQQLIHRHQLDDFLYTLLHSDRHANKVVMLDNSLFIAAGEPVKKPAKQPAESNHASVNGNFDYFLAAELNRGDLRHEFCQYAGVKNP